MRTIGKVCPEFGNVILVATDENASFLAALHQAKASYIFVYDI